MACKRAFWYKNWKKVCVLKWCQFVKPALSYMILMFVSKKMQKNAVTPQSSIVLNALLTDLHNECNQGGHTVVL